MLETVEPPPKPPLKAEVKVALTIWFVLLPPFLLFAGLAPMAFDAGRAPAAYLVVAIFWTYPITLGVAFAQRRRRPGLVWLPVINTIPLVWAGLIWLTR